MCTMAINRYTQSLNWWSKNTLCLFSPTAFAFACQLIATFELQSDGLQWHTLVSTTQNCSNFSILNIIIMMIIDTLVYLLLALYVEAVMPGEYGVPKKPLFFLDRHFWTGSTQPKGAGNVVVNPTGGLRASERDTGINIQHLTKKYASDCGDTSTWALQDVSFQMARDKISTLLGHNGAGKTTLMHILTGLFPPTSGSAHIDGYSVTDEIDQIHQRLGLCPQYNVLWDALTVNEHLLFSARLHEVSAADAEVEIVDLLSSLGLEDKRHALSSSLSGGMKRKLSVAMAYMGNPTIVILDEPTAGMDPTARRLTWDLILARRKGRAVMLSTHHMDEADLLSQHVVFIATGKIRASGNPLQVKKKYGKGYTLTLHLTADADRQAISALIKTGDTQAEDHEDNVQDASFIIPYACRAKFPAMLAKLDEQGQGMGVSSYGVTATSLEEIFITVTEQAELDDEEADDCAGLTSLPAGDNDFNETIELQTVNVPQSAKPGARVLSINGMGTDIDVDDVPLISNEDDDDMPLISNVDADTVSEMDADHSHKPRAVRRQSSDAQLIGAADDDGSADLTSVVPTPPKLSAVRYFSRRFRATFAKRFHFTKRDRRTFSSHVLLPVAFVSFAMVVASFFPDNTKLPPVQLWPSMFETYCGVEHGNSIPFQTPSPASAQCASAGGLVRSMETVFPDGNYINISDPSQHALSETTRDWFDGTYQCSVCVCVLLLFHFLHGALLPRALLYDCTHRSRRNFFQAHVTGPCGRSWLVSLTHVSVSLF